jgi:hypothetical protein
VFDLALFAFLTSYCSFNYPLPLISSNKLVNSNGFLLLTVVISPWKTKKFLALTLILCLIKSSWNIVTLQSTLLID